MIEPIFVIMMFDTLNARDLSLSLFFAFLLFDESYGSFSCVSFSDSFTFLLICFLKNPHLFTSDKREPFLLSLSLSLLVLFRFGERKRASRHRFFEGDDDDDGFAGLSLLLRGTAKHR